MAGTPFSGVFLFSRWFYQSFIADVILQKTQDIFWRMAVIQFPFCYCSIGDIKKLAKVLTVHTCHFPQFFYFGFAVHRIISINKKHTLRNYYSIGPTITQRVNCKLLSSVSKRTALLRIWLFLQRNRSSRLVLLQNLFSIFQHQLCHYINAAVKSRIIFRIIIDFAQ